jgi:predicted PurR-regulated permease PerM
MKTRKIEISYKTTISIILVLAGAAAVWYIRNIVVLFFLCFIFMEAINPAVNKLEKIRIPRPLAIISLYLIIFTTLFFAFAGLVPIVVEQTTSLVKAIPEILQKINFFGLSVGDLSNQLKMIEGLPKGIASTAVTIFTDIFSIFLVFVITFYLLLERKKMNEHCSNIFGEKVARKYLKIVEKLEVRLGSWVRAELILMIIIGVLYYILFTILGIKYAVPLAIIGGLFEIIPSFGPIITNTLGAIVGFAISPWTAVFAVGGGILIHSFENNLITPKVMKESCGLNPVLTIFLLLTGAKLASIPGMILAVPVYMTLETIFKIVIEKEE